jgi:hypothetical protein
MTVLDKLDIAILPNNDIHITDKETGRLYIYCDQTQYDHYERNLKRLDKICKNIRSGNFTYKIKDFALLATIHIEEYNMIVTFDEYIPTDYPDTDVCLMKREISYLRYKLVELSRNVEDIIKREGIVRGVKNIDIKYHTNPLET